MKALGLIVEYNPFHNGHLYHLTESKKKSGADVVIAVMSGQFTQRGEPAVADKWRRTKMALDMGVDLIVELPYAYATQYAEIFARGAVSILTHLKADYLIFGSESGNISELNRFESLTSSPKFMELLQVGIQKGLNLPRSQSFALQELGINPAPAQEPNNTLGVHYIRALRELKSPTLPETISRLHSRYSDGVPNHHSIASATSIRVLLEKGDPVDSYIPSPVLNQLTLDGTIPSWEPYYTVLRQKILTLGPDGLKEIHDVKEGIESRIYESAMRSNSFEELVKGVKTKRYTQTRIQRICAHILTHTTSLFIENSNLNGPVPYLRVLGMSTAGRLYLNQIKKEIPVPIYSKFSSSGPPMLKHEQKVTAAYGCVLSPSRWTRLNLDEFSRFPLLKD